MAKKSTKTAHVLNLISKSTSEPQEPAQAIEKQTQKAEHPATSPIQNSLTQNSKNDAISNQIKDSLLQELEHEFQIPQSTEPSDTSAADSQSVDLVPEGLEASEMEPTASIPSADAPDPAVADTSEQASASEDETSHTASDTSLEAQLAESLAEELTAEINMSAAIAQPVPHTTPLQDVLTDFSVGTESDNTNMADIPMATVHTTHPTEQASAATPSTSTAETTATPPATTNTTDTTPALTATKAPGKGNPTIPNETVRFRYINICEELVKEKLSEYMERFDVCTCDRCIVDTMALALTNLPSKYAVMDAHMKAPFLNFCASKYGVEIMTELTKACLIVAAHPRHTQEDLDAKNN